MLVQRGQHAAVNDPERGTEPLYQPWNIDMAGAGLKLPVVPEGFSGGVKLVKTLEQARGVRRQLGQVQLGQHPGKLLSERAQAVPLLLLEVRFQGLGRQSRIAAAELTAFRGIADSLLQRKFQSVPVVVGDRKEKPVIGPLLVLPGGENRLCRLGESLRQSGIAVVVANECQVPEVFRVGQRAEEITHIPRMAHTPSAGIPFLRLVAEAVPTEARARLAGRDDRAPQARKDPEPEPRNKEDGDSEEEGGDSLSHPVDVSPGCYNSGICLTCIRR